MIQVIDRALNILGYVAEHGKQPVKLINIADHVGISQPTCANIVKTLVAKNYLENVSRNEGYRLGAAAYHLTRNLAYSQNLVQISKGFMEELTAKVNETSLLGVIRNYKRHLLCVVQSDQDLSVRANNEVEVYPRASGRIMLAYLSVKELDNFIQNVGLPREDEWPQVQTKEKLLSALQQIRDTEIVETLSPKHIIGIAVPVYKFNKVVAGLSIFLPESRCTDDHRKKIIKQLKITSKKIKDQIEKEIGD